MGVSLKSMGGLRLLWSICVHTYVCIIKARGQVTPRSLVIEGLKGNTGSLVKDVDSIGQFPDHLMNLAVIQTNLVLF